MTMLGPYQLDSIVTGDARELAQAIPDESVDLIICDPVYWQIDDYRWLGHLAERVLVGGGVLLAQVGELFAFDAQAAIREACGLIHMPPLIEVYYFSLKAFQVGPTRVSSGYTPYLFATKGQRKVTVMNRFFGGRDKNYHQWGDGGAFSLQYVSTLSLPYAVVLDPFCGGGTVPAVCKMLGRHYLAFEIDPATANNARQRIANTQPPLFVPQPEQAAMFAEQEVAA